MPIAVYAPSVATSPSCSRMARRLTRRVKAERNCDADPRAACFYARRALELAVDWLYKPTRRCSCRTGQPLRADPRADVPGRGRQRGVQQGALHQPLGNAAVHTQPIKPDDALGASRELFHVCYWLARTYARGPKPRRRRWPSIRGAAAIPRPPHAPSSAQASLEALQETRGRDAQARRGARASACRQRRARRRAERLRAEVAEPRRPPTSAPPTRTTTPRPRPATYFIDLLLNEAGWPLDQARDREFEVDRHAERRRASGFVDYVLWGDDGKPLALVEAKRTRRDPRSASSRRSSTPTAWSSSSASGR